MAEIVYTNKAREDLLKIWNYTFDTWSESQADKYYEEIIDLLSLLVSIILPPFPLQNKFFFPSEDGYPGHSFKLLQELLEKPMRSGCFVFKSHVTGKELNNIYT